MEKDKEELLRIRKKYSFKYALTANMFELYIFYIILILFSFYMNNIMYGIVFTVLILIVAIFILIWQKNSAKETYLSFYSTKVVYKRKFLFTYKEKILEYDEIKDIVFVQGTNMITRIFQKAFHMGNIYIYPKKGNIFTNGMQLENVACIEKVIEDVKNIAGDKIK